MNQRTKILPYLLVAGLSLITLLILNIGFEYISKRDLKKRELEQSDEAVQISGSLAKGAKFDFHISKAAKLIKLNLKKHFLHEASANTSKQFRAKSMIPDHFPENDLWVFKNRGSKFTTIESPVPSSISRRGIAKAFNILANNKTDKTDNKILDYFFGPSMKVKYLALRNGMPSRVVYNKKPHILIWDRIKKDDKIAGGFFLLVPWSKELNLYAMKTRTRQMEKIFSSRQANKKRNCFAGYIRIFDPEKQSFYPAEMEKREEFFSFFKRWQTTSNLVKLERNRLPWGKEVSKNWKLYTKVLPFSSHLSFVMLKSKNADLQSNYVLKLLNASFLFCLFILFAAWLQQIKLPVINLKTRFTVLFFALTSIPFALFFVSCKMHLQEERTTLENEARNELSQAISSFDENVDRVYLKYRKKLHKLRDVKWLQNKTFKKFHNQQPLTELVGEYLESLDPPLPWASVFLVNPQGEMLSTYKSKRHEIMLEGVVQFSRVGVIEAMRLNNGIPSIQEDPSSSKISEADIALKNAYETEVKLPVYHAFSNRIIGNTTKLSLNESSIIRYIDYFPNAANPVTGLCIIWVETDLDKVFCLQAIKNSRKTNPGFGFNIYKNTSGGLRKLAQNLKNSDLNKEALIAFNRGSTFFSQNEKQILKVAMPSKRRPKLILAGSMDTSHIDEKLYRLKKTYAFYFISGLLAVIFFLQLLQTRLIKPISKLIYYLDEIKAGHYNQVKIPRRNDEFKNIFAAYNQMIDGLKVRQRLLSITSDSAIKELRHNLAASNSKNIKTNQVVCLVSDIRNFTTLCEKYDPETITRLLNLHFDRMSQIIHSHNGEIIRFVGDAIEARFPCPEDKREKVFTEVTKAALQMLATLELINQERNRQKLFTYNIGIGISYGSTSSFAAGEKFGRAELLQVGEPLERAIKLEELSKNYPDFPLLIDGEIGKELSKSSRNKFKLVCQSLESYDFFVFEHPPESSDFFNSSLAKDSETTNKQSTQNAEKGKNNLTAFILEKFNKPVVVFITGCLILFWPAFYAVQNIYEVHRSHQNTLRSKAHKQNSFVLETRKLPQARKELLEIQLRKKITTLANKTESSFSEQEFPNLKKQLKNEIDSYGVECKNIVFAKYKDAISRPSSDSDFPGKDLEANLRCVLNECLRLNDCQLNVFLQPDPEIMSYLGELINKSNFIKEARTRFINVNLASEPYWLYWQPIYNTHKTINKQTASKRFRAYGSFSSNERNSHILGGALILCKPPESPLKGGNKNDSSQYVFARIDLKKQTLIEQNGNLKKLINEHKSLYPEFASNNISKAEMLIALSQQKYSKKTNWAFDFEVIQKDKPELNLVATHIPSSSLNYKIFVYLGITFFILYSSSVLFLWFKSFYREQFIAKTITRQILGSFTGLLIFPVIGIFITLTILINGWQSSLLQNARQNFLERSQKFEQKLQMHHYLVPQKLEKFMNHNRAGRFFKGSKRIKNKLGDFLKLTYKHLNTKARALGVNSIMINTYSGRKEFLLMDGTLASDSNPMKQTFGYHTDQLIERLNNKNLKKMEQKNPRAKLSEEIAAELVLNVLASSYGNDIVLDLLFGFRKPVKFFSGYSSQVAYQYLFPNSTNPLGLIIFSLSYYHSNIFSLSRIMASEYFNTRQDSLLPTQIFAINNPLPGLPVFPENGEKFPFIKELGQKSILVGDINRWTEYDNKKYYLSTYQSILAPQFTFAGIIKESDFNRLINQRAFNFAAIMVVFIVLLLALATQTTRDFITPLHSLLSGMKKIGQGNYQARISFDREDEFATLARAFNNMAQNLSEKNKLAKMVSESAVEMASSDEAELQARKGQRRLVAVLYLGIQNYPELIASNTPNQVQAVLNAWIDQVSEVVTSLGGEIDKVMEGKILGTFFADKKIDSEQAHHENSDFVLKAFNAAVKLCHGPQQHSITVGAGIYKGIVISGLMGNKERRDLTVIGDTVNIAARCFSIAARQAQKPLIITTAETINGIEKHYNLEAMGNFSIKGKKEKINLFKITANS